MHHEWLHPNHRHLPGLNETHRLVDHLDVVWLHLRGHYLLLLVHVRWRPVLRKTVLQGVRRRSCVLHLYPSCSPADPDDSHQTTHTCLYKFVAARSLLKQNQCISQCGAEKYDRLSRVLRVHNRWLGCVLKRANKGTDPVRRPGNGCVHHWNHILNLTVDQLADARRVFLFGVVEPFGECLRLDPHAGLALFIVGHCCLHPRRTRADHCGHQVQHQKPERVRNHGPDLWHNSTHL